MTPVKDVKRDADLRVAKVMAGTWGLGRCTEQQHCLVCERYHGRPELIMIRNVFVGGMPPAYIPYAFEGVTTDLTTSDVQNHAWRQSWTKRRKQIPRIVVNEDTMNLLLMRRFMDSQGVVSGTSADKTLENMMKLNGLGKETKEIRGNIGFSWEAKMTRDREQPGVILLEDDGIGDDDEDNDIDVSPD